MPSLLNSWRPMCCWLSGWSSYNNKYLFSNVSWKKNNTKSKLSRSKLKSWPNLWKSSKTATRKIASVPPSSDQLKKPSDKSKRKKGKKRGPKYDHAGKTRNRFGQPDKVVPLELEKLLGSDFEGILSSDCFSAYSPQGASAKQKCLAHLERDLKALQTSRFADNREFATKVLKVLWQARTAHRDYQDGILSREALSQQRAVVEASLKEVLSLDSQPKRPIR